MDELARLRAENAELRAEVAEWRRRETASVAGQAEVEALALVRRALNIGPIPSRILLTLIAANGGIVTPERLLRCMNWEASDYAEPLTVLSVHVYTLRSALRKAGLLGAVENIRNAGYRIAPATADAIQALWAPRVSSAA